VSFDEALGYAGQVFRGMIATTEKVEIELEAPVFGDGASRCSTTIRAD
jgi:hypothetical protein